MMPQAAGLPTVDFTFFIEANLSWKLYFFKQRVEIDRCPTLASTSHTMKSPNDIVDVISVIESSQVCVGNPDEKFLPLLKRHQQPLLNGDGKVPGLLNITLLFMENAMYYRMQKPEVSNWSKPLIERYSLKDIHL